MGQWKRVEIFSNLGSPDYWEDEREGMEGMEKPLHPVHPVGVLGPGARGSALPALHTWRWGVPQFTGGGASPHTFPSSSSGRPQPRLEPCRN